jgi:probable HAF family extracellular repeat protein
LLFYFITQTTNSNRQKTNMTTRRPIRRIFASAIMAIGVFPLCAQAQTASFRQLPALGGNEAWAQKVSENGGTIVGGSEIAPGEYRATAWTSDGTAKNLGTLGGGSYAEDVSADGSVIVGYSRNGSGTDEPFVWTEESGMMGLGTLGGSSARAAAVSADGSVIVGYSRNGSGTNEAFVWTEELGMMGLGTLGGSYSAAYGVSADGSVIVGSSRNGSGTNEAFVWTEEMGMMGLSTLGGSYSAANGVSADGSVIVGYSDGAHFVWTAESEMLPLNESESGWVWSLTNDGSVAAGASYGQAAVWDTTTLEVREVQSLLLEDHGIDISDWHIEYCSISGDGYTLVGAGSDPNGHYAAWVVTINKSPEELLEDLVADVAMINIDSGISNQLDNKLDSAIDAFLAKNADQRNDAVKKMNGFINSVEAQRGKKISDAAADYLVSAAEGIIALME